MRFSSQVPSLAVCLTLAACRAPAESPASDAAPRATADASSVRTDVADVAAGDLSIGDVVAPPTIPDVASDAEPPRPRRAPGDGFRSFRAGRLRAGRANAPVPDQPVLLWQHDLGAPLRAQPVLAPDGTIVAAALDGSVVALDRDGRRRWSFQAGDRIYSTPCITGDGLVLFGADTDSIYALRPDGRVAWTILPAGDTERPELHDVDTAPIAARGVGYVAAGLYVYAFDLRGTVRWRTATGGKVYSSPALLPDGTVVVGSQDDKLWAFRPAGAVRWTYDTAADLDATPAVDDLRRVIYAAGDDGKVHAVDFDGKPLWKTDVGGFVRSGVAVDLEGRVYVTTFGPTARLVALDPDGGWVRWTSDAGTGPTAEFGIRSAPVVAPDGTVLYGAPGGFVRAVSPGGETLWTFPVPDDVDSGPILADDGTIYFGCDDGFLRALSPSSPPS
ncbi:MAG: PQQ-binding-like beta-propeller repeat protein [Myxococcales bacterium]|nr:PQQ-binding-like beta-propeller repeat protein [Myxococcales bacterium]